LALAAATNPDILYLFEKDMCSEVTDLFSSNTVEVTSRSSLPPDMNPFNLYGVFAIKELLIGLF
jgi:hypothetical protein